MSPGPAPSRVGIQATASFEPMVGMTPASPTSTMFLRAPHARIASRTSAVPTTAGYPGASQDSASASRISAGVGSTGVPTDRSQMPSGWAAACFL